MEDLHCVLTHYSPFTTHYSLLTTHYSLLTTHYSLQADDLPPLFLVKWRGLPYNATTWESCYTLLHEQQSTCRFRQFEVAPSAHEKRMFASATRPPRSNFRKLESSPEFKTGHSLRPYQLEGVNWLLFSWYAQRSVMLADEMGLGKTIQSVSVLNHLWKHEAVRRPL